jgi:hypothetical protein
MANTYTTQIYGGTPPMGKDPPSGPVWALSESHCNRGHPSKVRQAAGSIPNPQSYCTRWALWIFFMISTISERCMRWETSMKVIRPGNRLFA